MTALGTRTLIVSVGGTDYSAQVSDCRITSAESDSDFVTFADAAAGGARDYKLAFKAVQDTAAASLWDKIWTAAGTTVAVIVKPHGAAAASATTPWFNCNAVVTEPDGDLLGGEADASTTARFTVECEWPLTAKPVRQIV